MTTPKYVDRSDQIPDDDLQKIRARVIAQINSMDAADLKIMSQSDASLRAYISEIFRSVAQLFGYIVGYVVGSVLDIGSATKKGLLKGWEKGFNG